MKPETKKTILISVWICIAAVFLSALGYYIYTLSQFKNYRNAQLQFEMKYPSDWQMKERFLNTAVAFVRSKETALDTFQANINVTVQDVPNHIATLETYSETISKQMKAVFDKNITIQADKEFTFGDRKGHRLELIAPTPQNLKAIFIWTIKDSRAYIFTFICRVDQYKDIETKIDEAIKSFRFLF